MYAQGGRQGREGHAHGTCAITGNRSVAGREAPLVSLRTGDCWNRIRAGLANTGYIRSVDGRRSSYGSTDLDGIVIRP
jgi:hypothetical protein